MPGRYEFSLPEPHQRDGWFRIGNVDVTTTVLVILLGLVSMLVYAIDRVSAFKGAFVSDLVRSGEVWRLATWPLTNPPDSIWALIGLAVFWFLGHLIEDQMGRKPFAVMLAAMAVVPTAIVSVLNITNGTVAGRWSAYSYSVSFLSLGLIVIYGIDRPGAKFFFGIPAWVIAAAYVFIEVLRDVGNRAWAQLILVLLVIAVGCIVARQRGMLDQLAFVPRIRRLAGPPRSPYGEPRSARPKASKASKRAKRWSRRSTTGTSSVVSGPWQGSGGPTPLEQAELDVLLERINAVGIDALTPHEKARLNDLSRRMRGS
ncbi:MAG: hypothetical protein JWN46_684 [Acidimicrobiales bacterium]|nr:hypothetical protein [Acidimicrobiales bacterium]